ncbi:DUF1501 domain-containing protein [Thiocapsa marina]|uniref:DUF1501 domain-containing protein n=1 Tax=Thiocapsa marina 5811 TaxID=768671 RepID=F9UI50_9GAMM|nr:DUF1501 domain-containing protein [Thiocapsa marina]EGV16109.1 protein of unknown function DUF1501 [Thiocapsa marina 5811]
MKPKRPVIARELPSPSRRQFLRLSGGCAGLLSTSLVSSIINLKMTNAAYAAAGDTSGYKALVCVFLLGGNDSWNMLVPYESGEYNDYAGIRRDLALRRSSLLPITDTQTGRRFGVHPRMNEIRNLYNRGNSPLAFVTNVGSLIEPTDKQGFVSGRNLPVSLFSHSDEQRHWQTSLPQSAGQETGWAGRMADILTDSVNDDPAVGMNIALNSLNVFQTGRRVLPYVVGADGAIPSNYYKGSGIANSILTKISDRLLTDAYANEFEGAYALAHREAIDLSEEYDRATRGATVRTAFPRTDLGAQLRQVARAIAARGALGHRRQTFFVSMGGWDHHDELLNAQAAMLPELSQALAAFYEATVELGVDQDVVTFTASDFGRTLSSNGNGSDHAWGGNQIIMGGSVVGGRLYGDYPETLRAGSELDVGRGRLIPTTSVDEYNAELALWFGVQNNRDLDEILPNIRNFDFPRGIANGPLGALV